MSGLFSSLYNAARGGNLNQGGAGPDDEESSTDGSENPGSPGLWQGDPTGTENAYGSPTAVEEQWGGLGTGNVNTRRPTYGRATAQQTPRRPSHSQPFISTTTRSTSPQVLYPLPSLGQTGSLMGGEKPQAHDAQVPPSFFPTQAQAQHPQQQSAPAAAWVQPQNVPLPMTPNALHLSMEGGPQSTPKRKTRPLPRNPDGENTPLLSPVGRTQRLSGLPLPSSHAAQQSSAPPPQQAHNPSRQQSRVGTPRDNPRSGARAGEENGGGRDQGPEGIWVGGQYYRVYPQAAGADGGVDGMWMNGIFYGLQPSQEDAPQRSWEPRVQAQAQAPPPWQAPELQQPVFLPQQQPQYLPSQQPQYLPQHQYHQQPFPQFAPQPQYAQPPARRERQLPPTDKCEALKGNTNFPTWSHWVRNLLAASGLLSHISRPGEPGLRPSQRPTYPPTEDNPRFEEWWSDDDATRHVVTSRVDPAILKSLPTVSAVDGGPVTARELWELLGKQYGAGMISTTLQKWNNVVARKIFPSQTKDLTQYAADFREAYNAMVISGQVLSTATILVTIANALPEISPSLHRSSLSDTLYSSYFRNSLLSLSFFSSTDSTGNIFGLPIVPTASKAFTALFGPAVSPTYTLLDKGEFDIFKACDADAIFIEDLPESTRKLFKQSGPKNLNLRLLDTSRVVQYLSRHPVVRGVNPTVEPSDDLVEFLSQFWTWFDNWGHRAELLPRLQGKLLIPCLHGVKGANTEKPVFELTRTLSHDPDLRDFFVRLGVPFLTDKEKMDGAKQVLLKYGLVKSPEEVKPLLECLSHSESDLSASPPTVHLSKVLLKYFNTHMPKTQLRDYSEVEVETFRKLPIFPIVEWDRDLDGPDLELKRRYSAVYELTSYGVEAFGILPLLPNTVFVDATLLDRNLIPLLNDGEHAPLSDMKILELSIKRFDQQPKRVLAAILKHVTIVTIIHPSTLINS